MSVNDCKLIKIPIVHDVRGDLAVIESFKNLPFEIKRVYYLYNVPTNSERGGHAHKNLKQLIIALSGSFQVRLDDGVNTVDYYLRDPSEGLLISTCTWREILKFSHGSVCLVLASELYDENDYYRDYSEFIASLKS